MKWFGICAFSFFLVLSIQIHIGYYWQSNYQGICDLVFDNYYKPIISLNQWHRACVSDQSNLNSSTTTESFAKRLRWRFSKLPGSHLGFYSPAEFNDQWKGEEKSTGIESHWVEGQLLVLRVWPGSPAAIAGVKKGDIVEQIKGYNLDDYVLSKKGGEIVFLRLEKRLELKILPGSFQRQEGLESRWLKDKAYYLRVPSFRNDFFAKQKLLEISKQMMTAKHVILDLRGNAGGNIVAGSRLLSLFTCGQRTVGYLDQPRKPDPKPVSFSDDLSDLKQVKKLLRFQSISILTFEGYGCYKGPVTVLIDHATASVSEVVSAAFKQRECSQIMGSVTAGRIILAIWFPLPDLGPGYSVSVPVAAFRNPVLGELEGPGISADKMAFYDLGTESRGQDSWVTQAEKNPPQCLSSKSRSTVKGFDAESGP